MTKDTENSQKDKDNGMNGIFLKPYISEKKLRGLPKNLLMSEWKLKDKKWMKIGNNNCRMMKYKD